ncbi:MAG TPA: helix-hairpin-helix domain-containing protein [Gemmatimonadaceae bacterium]|nr:helix-hairpin-helix domain-containing protein [Gemmatimonadaceae bacterium]
MPTPAEKKALLFLASVGLLGASVRVLRAVGTIDAVPAANARALDGQLAAVDSARRAKQGKGKARSRPKRGRRHSLPDTLPGSDTTIASPAPNGKPATTLFRAKVDVDIATAGQLDALPGVGPVMARRIVADREKRGPFGSLANLRRVKGIGPALAARLDSLVTFSGTPRPPSATPTDSSATERQGAHRASRARRGGRGGARVPNGSVPPLAPGSGYTRPPSLTPPAQWQHPSSPSSESVISSSARGSSRASNSHARSKSSARAGRGSGTISSSSGSSKRTS